MLVVLLAAGLWTPAMADSISVGNRVISDGDAVGIVFEVLGKPDRTVDLENPFGAALAERWEYYRDGKTISIIVAGSKVISITETRNR
jgi:hypothetical protein